MRVHDELDLGAVDVIGGDDNRRAVDLLLGLGVRASHDRADRVFHALVALLVSVLHDDGVEEAVAERLDLDVVGVNADGHELLAQTRAAHRVANAVSGDVVAGVHADQLLAVGGDDVFGIGLRVFNDVVVVVGFGHLQRGRVRSDVVAEGLNAVIQRFVFNVHVHADDAGIGGHALLFHRGEESLTGQFADGVVGAIVELVVILLIRAVVAGAQTAVDEVQHDAHFGGLARLRHGGVDGQGRGHDRAGVLRDGVFEGRDVLLGLLLFGGADDGVVDGDAQFLFQVSLGLQDTDFDLAPERGGSRGGQVDDVVGFCRRRNREQTHQQHAYQSKYDGFFHGGDPPFLYAAASQATAIQLTARPFAG